MGDGTGAVDRGADDERADDAGGDALALGVGSLNGAVIATAVALALPLAYAAGARYGFAAGFLMLVLVSVLVPALYERDWPDRYGSTRTAVAWTAVVGPLLAAVYAGLLLVGLDVGFGPRGGPALAFVAAWLLGMLSADALGG